MPGDQIANFPASLWTSTAAPAPEYSSVRQHATADVAVIGAGYTGLTAALHLARFGKRVIVTDAFEPGWGASGRNGGQIIPVLKHDPNELLQMFGPTRGEAIIQEISAGADLVLSLISRYAIDCHATQKGWIQCASAPRAFRNYIVPRQRQWAALAVDAQLLSSERVTQMLGCSKGTYSGAWLDPRGGLLQPLSYARGLARAVLSEGAMIYTHAPALKLHRSGDRWDIELRGGRISAHRVVLATNAYTDDLWPGLRQSIIPVSSFQLATAPLPPGIRATILPGGQGVSDIRRLLKYFRLDHQGRLLMGGRSPVDEDPTLRNSRSLKEAIAELYPQAADITVEFIWSGKVALTLDSMPHLHVLAPGLVAAVGCQGRGVANFTVVGKVIAELVNGTEPGDLPLPVTAPNTIPLHRLRKLGIFAVSRFYSLLDTLDSLRS